MGTPDPKPQRWCKACATLVALPDMVPVSNESADLGDVLADLWMCADEQACLARYSARSKGEPILFAVIVLAGLWATGGDIRYTRNPRLAHQRAARLGGDVVPLRAHTSYRKA